MQQDLHVSGLACEFSEHDHNTDPSADVSISRYREQVSRIHHCLDCILQNHQTLPRVSPFGILTPFGPIGFSYLRSPRTRRVGLESRTKSKFFSSQTKRPERDLYVPETVIVQFDLSVGHQAPKCNLLINTTSYTALYARLRFPDSVDIARTTACRRPIFDYFSCHTKTQKSQQADHNNIISDIRISHQLKSPYGGASLTRFVTYLAPRLYTWLPLSPNKCGSTTVNLISPARPEPDSSISTSED